MYKFLGATLLICCVLLSESTNGQQRRGVDTDELKPNKPLPITPSARQIKISPTQIPGGDSKFKIDPSLLAQPNLKIGDVSAFENTAQVIAPGTNQACMNGKVVLSTGEPLAIYTRDLFNAQGKLAQNAMPIKSKQPSINDGWLGTDNVLVKGKDGSLLLLRNSVVWKDIANKPKWWTKYKISGQPNGARVVTSVLKSTDCGVSWQHITEIDPLNFDNGKFAVPRPIINAFGGWDRLEGYVDPWNGNIYVSLNAGAGVPDANGNVQKTKNEEGKDTDQQIYSHFLFKSTDNGKTWVKVHEFGAWTPIVMTSTPNGRLYLYSVMGDQPMIKYSLLSSANTTFSEWVPINYNLFGSAKIPAGANPVYSCAVYKATNSISRASLDSSSKVRISYSMVNGFGQTGIAVAQVEVPSDTAPPVTKPLALLFGQDFGDKGSNKTSILSSSFIDPDIAGVTQGKSIKSVLYWVQAKVTSNTPILKKSGECSSFSGTVSANYMVFDSDKAIGFPTSQFLSQAQLSQPRTWNIPNLNANGRFYGDYAYGGSFFANGRIHFLGQWREPDGVYAGYINVKP